MILNTLQKLFLFVFGTLAVLTATAGIFNVNKYCCCRECC